MNQQKVVIAEDFGKSLKEAMEVCERDKVFILMDETTAKCCLPVVEAAVGLQDAKRIIIGPMCGKSWAPEAAHATPY